MCKASISTLVILLLTFTSCNKNTTNSSTYWTFKGVTYNGSCAFGPPGTPITADTGITGFNLQATTGISFTNESDISMYFNNYSFPQSNCSLATTLSNPPVPPGKVSLGLSFSPSVNHYKPTSTNNSNVNIKIMGTSALITSSAPIMMVNTDPNYSWDSATLTFSMLLQ